MNRSQLNNFIVYLQKENWLVFGPTENNAASPEEISPYLAAHGATQDKIKSGEIFINQILNPKELVLDERLPFYPFKKFSGENYL